MGIHSEDIPMGYRLLLQEVFSHTRRSAAVPNQVFLKKCMKICCSNENSTPLKCPKQVAIPQFVLNALTLNRSIGTVKNEMVLGSTFSTSSFFEVGGFNTNCECFCQSNWLYRESFSLNVTIITCVCS